MIYLQTVDFTSENMENEKNIPESELRKERKEATSFEEGLQMATTHIKDKLRLTKSRPLIVLVNGLTGSGKSHFAMLLESRLVSENVKGVHVETDLYQNQRFTPEEFAVHKIAWEHGEEFTRHNMKTRKDEIVTEKPDVVIISGGGASPEHALIYGDLKVVMQGDPLERIGSRIFRDHIQHTDAKPDPEHFMHELANPKSRDDNILKEFEEHKGTVRRYLENADLIVKNTTRRDEPNFKLTIEKNKLHFVATHENTNYDILEPVTLERLERLKQALEIKDD